MSMPRRRLFFLPEPIPGEAGGNSYIEMIARCWDHAGYDRIPMPRGWKQILKGIRDRGKTTCVANWIDNVLISPEGKVRLSGVLAYIKTIVKLHLLCKQFVFVRHNVYPHATKGKSRAIARMLIDLSEVLMFDTVLVHSAHYQGRSRKVIHHPAYEFTETEAAGPPSDDLIYFGNFARYKKLETLIEAWDRPSRLIIAGGCRGIDYLNDLKALAVGKNIEFRTDWLSDDEALRLVRSCAAMVLPHSGEDMIISSSLYFGLSCGVPVLCNQNLHAKQLVSEEVPGVVCIDDLTELNRIDIPALQAIDRQKIEAAIRSRCGVETVAALINQLISSKNA